MDFKKVFGLDSKYIRKNCIILPANDRNLFDSLKIDSISRGMFYDVADTGTLSLITVKNRCLSGDCVLMLDNTDCRNIILFGSSGGITMDIGDKAIPDKSLDLEGFSRFMVSEDLAGADFYRPDERLRDRFIEYAGRKDYKTCVCATVSSLVLEEERSAMLESVGIDCVDMESSMVFSAASRIKRSAIALLYTADKPGRLNFYDEYEGIIREKIKGSRKSIAKRLIRFIADELS